jgi:signal transduction histidine kinase/CHASE3 domain sensor protein
VKRATASRFVKAGIAIPLATVSLDAPIEAALKRRVTGSFIVAVLLTIFMGFFSWRSTWLTAKDAGWVAHTYAVMDMTDLTTKHVIEVETGARSFAMSGQEPLLAHYKTARGTVTQEEDALRSLTADNPNEGRLLDVLNPQVRSALEFADSLVAQRRQTQAAPGAAEILETERLMDAVRATTQEMHDEEMRLLSQRTSITEAGRRLTGFIIVIGIFVGAGLLTVARSAVNRQIDVSAQGRTELEVLNAELEQRVEQRTAALRQSDARRRFALETAKLGDWELNLDTMQATRSLLHDQIFGYPSLLPEWNVDIFLGRVHPDDRERVRADFAGCLKRGEKWEFESRIICPNGDMRWIWACGDHYRDSSGKATWLAGIIQDVTQQKAIEKEIKMLNSELEQRVVERTAQLETANKELEAFSYSVSHDLRAPLRHISGFSKMLSEEFSPALDATAQRYIDRIQVGTQKMGLLVDELLNLARVGRHILRLQPTGLNSIVAEVIAILEPDREGRQVEWAIADLPAVECDPVLVKQIFQNLLANALKFTRPRTHAIIEISHKEKEEDGQLVFMVRDNGIGFNMKYVDKLFGVFQRLHSTDEFEGTGIGLVIVQRIVHKHGGRVWAEGVADKGAAFFFTLGVGKQAKSKNHAATAGGQS